MEVKTNTGIRRLPDFMIAGAAKCGTTTLYDFLDQHPRIYFPPGKKEPHYFSFGGLPPKYLDARFVQTLTWRTQDYLALYENAGRDKLLGDASTSYLYNAHEAIANIRKLYGEDKAADVAIIITIRNPIQRAFSHYNYLVRNGFEQLPFEVVIQQEVSAKRKKLRWGFDYLGYGEYTEGIRLFQSSFKKVKVVLFEELAEAGKLSKGLCDFLDIEPHIVTAFPKVNPSGRPRSRWMSDTLLRNPVLKSMVNILPSGLKRQALLNRDKLLGKVLVKDPMSEEARVYLVMRYKYSIMQLERLLNKDLSSWLA